MPNEELLNKLVGTGVPYESILGSCSNFELCELNRLARKYNFKSTDFEYTETVMALYRFKQTLRYYMGLWMDSSRKKIKDLRTEIEIGGIFIPISRYLDDPSKKCFAHTQFFGHIHFLLSECHKHKITQGQRKTYLKALYNFPVIPSTNLQEVVDHEIWPANLPYVFMHMAAGLIRTELIRGRNHRKILGIYKTFLRERNISKAHMYWFNKRLPGSAGSRQ